MSAFREPSKPEDLAVPSADRALVSALVEAFIATRPKPEAIAFLQKTAQILADREERDNVVVRLRKNDRERQLAEAKANREATAMFRQMLEGCIARLNAPPITDDDDT